jgi:DNA-cytosine methyltransferase
MNEFTHLDLFSGIGGFSLGFESAGFTTVAFCEFNETKRIVLRHWWPGLPILPNVKDTVEIMEFCRAHGIIDVLTAGVPCQPTSALGQQRGTADERWLWPDTIRVVGAIRPRFAVFENPPALLTLEDGRAFNGIVSELVSLGYDLLWDVFPAAALGAGHLRERLIIVAANSDNISERRVEQRATEAFSEYYSNDKNEVGASSNTNNAGLQGHSGNEIRSWGGQNERRPTSPPDLRGRVQDFGNGFPWWHEVNTGVSVLAHGIPSKLAEAAALCSGDAIVPQVAQVVAEAIRKVI